MQAIRINDQFSQKIENEIEDLIRNKYPGRNEKYYSILLITRQNLIRTSFVLSLTTDKIVKECNAARPTWYSYFKNTEHFYKNVFAVLSEVMIEHALTYLRNNTHDHNWTSVHRSLKIFVFLANTKNLASYFESIKKEWDSCYHKTVIGYAEILSPILKLSPGRGQLFVRNLANELILHSEKYYTNFELFDRFALQEHHFFLAEQNN